MDNEKIREQFKRGIKALDIYIEKNSKDKIDN